MSLTTQWTVFSLEFGSTICAMHAVLLSVFFLAERPRSKAAAHTRLQRFVSKFIPSDNLGNLSRRLPARLSQRFPKRKRFPDDSSLFRDLLSPLGARLRKTRRCDTDGLLKQHCRLGDLTQAAFLPQRYAKLVKRFVSAFLC